MDPVTPAEPGRRKHYIWWALDAAVIVAAMVALARLLSPAELPPERIGNFDDWRPTPAEIRTAVGVGRPGEPTDPRHVQFAEMFKSRFRRRGHAVGVRFTDARTVCLQTAGMTPRWDMAHVAVAAKEEADAVFGVDHRVAIFQTYIGMAPRQVGELVRGPNGRDLIDLGRVYPWAAHRAPRTHRPRSAASATPRARPTGAPL